MKIPKNEIQEFYEHLGKLFYAIAAIDNSISDTEYEFFENVITIEWIPIADLYNNFDSEVDKIIISNFNNLANNDADAQNCFDDFINYKNNHNTLFTKEKKLHILKTVNMIASVYSKKNKSELILLSKLYLNFKE